MGPGGDPGGGARDNPQAAPGLLVFDAGGERPGGDATADGVLGAATRGVPTDRRAAGSLGGGGCHMRVAEGFARPDASSVGSNRHCSPVLLGSCPPVCLRYMGSARANRSGWSPDSEWKEFVKRAPRGAATGAVEGSRRRRGLPQKLEWKPLFARQSCTGGYDGWPRSRHMWSSVSAAKGSNAPLLWWGVVGTLMGYGVCVWVWLAAERGTRWVETIVDGTANDR